MRVRIYALWPLNAERGVMENRITAIEDPEMWLEPTRTCCIDLMEPGDTPAGFVRLHHTPDWVVTLPRRLLERPG